MIKIPKKIKIGGITVPIYIVKNASKLFTDNYNEERNENDPILIDDNSVDAFYEPTIKRFGIYLDKELKGGQLENTFLHELVHAILGHIQEHDLSNNEHLVQNIADKLHQIIPQITTK